MAGHHPVVTTVPSVMFPAPLVDVAATCTAAGAAAAVVAAVGNAAAAVVATAVVAAAVVEAAVVAAATLDAVENGVVVVNLSNTTWTPWMIFNDWIFLCVGVQIGP